MRDLGKIWRVYQFAASGIVLLAADSGTGKTTLVNLCIEAIQEGTPFLGAFKTEQAKALLIQGDEPKKFAERKFWRQELKRNFDVIYPEGPNAPHHPRATCVQICVQSTSRRCAKTLKASL